MYYESKKIIKGMHLLIHVVINASTFCLTYKIRNIKIFTDQFGPTVLFNEYITPLAIVCLLWPFIFLGFNLYGVNTKSYRLVTYIKTMLASATGCSVVAVILFFQRDIAVSRLFLLMFLVINSFGLIIGNEIYRYVVKKALYSTQHSKRVLIVTCSQYRKEILKALKNEGAYITTIVDTIIVEDNQYIEHFDQLLGGKMIDEVLFSLGRKNMMYLEDYIICCETMGISANVVATFYELPQSTIHVGKLGGIPVLKYATTPQSQSNLLIKRLIDITGAIIGLTITLIVSVILVPAILMDSKGSVFFKQTRIGKNGRPFTLYKFRSMCNDAEYLKTSLVAQNEMNGAMFKIENDPRITNVGKFIRKTSLDELPQFWNVLQGDMSLVGTRPPLPEEVKQYKRHHWKRLSMKPGLTGLWQTSGRNKIMDFDVIAKLDSEYIDHWSLRLDLKLLIKTIRVVVCGYGAS